MISMRFVFITMDGNHGAALKEATTLLYQRDGIRLQTELYDATDFRSDDAINQLEKSIQTADFVFGSMLFGEEFIRPLQKILEISETETCIITSNPALIRCTSIGKLSFAPKKEESSPGIIKKWLKRLRPKSGHGETKRQLAMLRNLGKIMRFIPGKARDLHTYIAVHDYWLHASPENIYRMLVLLIERYVPSYTDKLKIENPIHYPDAAIYHPDADEPFADLNSYEQWRRKQGQTRWNGSVGLLSLRTVILSGNTAHLDLLIRTLEARGIETRAAYSAGLDFRPAIDQFYMCNGDATVDVLLNGAGFSLVGGMAESRPKEAVEVLNALDVGYLDMIPLAFQKVEEWQIDDTGLNPMQMAMNIAIPELDGAAEPIVYGGPTSGQDAFIALPDQINHVVQRIERRVGLKRKQNEDKSIAIVLFNFPPTLGNIGTAAYLDVFNSVFRMMQELADEGYRVELPESADALREACVEGNAMMYGTDGNVGARLSLENYRDLFPEYVDIEPFWGYAPGELLNDGNDFYILGAQFGNVFIAIQPSFGYERDPMRLLMAKDATPHHGFAAFYTYLEHIFCADAVLHFGTHGALEFMPGKQAGMSTECWTTRLLGSLPNFYYYSVNNPSEATIAKRRGLATLISYMVPPLQQAGLYKGLRILKDSIDSYRQRPTPEMVEDIRLQAEKIGITVEAEEENYIAALSHELIKVEHRMIPMGLHVLGDNPSQAELVDIMAMVAAFKRVDYRGSSHAPLPQQIAEGMGWDYQYLRDTLKTDSESQERWQQLDVITRDTVSQFMNAPRNGHVDTSGVDVYLRDTANIQNGRMDKLWDYLDDLLDRTMMEKEIEGLMRSLNGGFIPPSPGNDVVRNSAVVPTGRNIHGLDPFNVPTPAAQDAGKQLMREMLTHLTAEQGSIPETIAMILWGTDNLKSDCEGVAQVLWLIGARPIQDELGKVSDVELLSLEELGRPRIDVVVTVSGIFRDLLRHQMSLIDKAIKLAAQADEPDEFNFIRKHSRAHAEKLGISLLDASARVFSNAPGSYGANVNHLVESSNWENEDELSDAFMQRKSYTFDKYGNWRDARDVMEQSMGTVDAAFQNIDSFEVGISDIDHYYEYLGGAAKSIEKFSGKMPTILVADAISTTERLSTLEQMVRLESRAKLLNPKWYDAMLKHGYEGVAEIETRVSNTYGWSATTNAVEGWVYNDIAETFLLDDEMKDRLSTANPHATAAIARRLLEAEARGYWDADNDLIDQLRDIYGNLEDQMEGIKQPS